MIGWRDEDGRVHRGSLFAAFAALANGAAWSFPALRPHQREPWHAFTVQVAAMALIRSGNGTLPQDETGWRDLLMTLTPDQPEAWELVVDDWTKPALLQPPIVSAGDRAAYAKLLRTPDALDMLVTARNHDLKRERMSAAMDEYWLFALITLQTTEGYLGAGNWGISRMNGGYSNRMSFSIRPTSGGATAAFRSDVERLVTDGTQRQRRSAQNTLLWIKAWDGSESLAYPDLDELYVEICRRIRLRRNHCGNIEAVATGSESPRVAYKEVGGDTLDPWAPLTTDNKKGSLTYGRNVSIGGTSAGFGYEQMSRLLDGRKTTPAPLTRLPTIPAISHHSLVASALVRGEGKTEGLHRRTIPIVPPNRPESVPIDRIGLVSRKRADEAYEAQRRLKRAIVLLLQGGTETPRFDDATANRKAERWLGRFDDLVDAAFFSDAFWSEVADAPANHRLPWRSQLHDMTREVLDTAIEQAPGNVLRRQRAATLARNRLDREMRSWTKEVLYGE